MSTPAHARFELDEVIHAPVRFSIVAALAKVDEAEFAAVRDAVQVSDSVLSAAGEAAFTRHLAALRAIAEG